MNRENMTKEEIKRRRRIEYNFRKKMKYRETSLYPQRPWSEEDELYVIENYGKMTYREMSPKLSRSENSICQRVAKLKREGKL